MGDDARAGDLSKRRLGASEETFRRADQGELRRSRVADLVEGTYSTGDRAFDLAFRFARNGLRTVLLRYEEPEGTAGCNGLRDDLISSYGSPVEERRGVTTWLDRRGGNRVSFTSLGIGFCYVMYSRPTAAGL